MSRVRQTKINGKDIQIYVLKATHGVAMTQKLGSLAATFFGESTESDDGEVSIDFTKIANGLQANLTSDELDMMIKALLKDMAIDGRDVNYDDYFAGNYGMLVKVIAYALQENFGSFLEGLDILGE